MLQEAAAYLHFLSAYYDKLPHAVFFVQASELSWHHSGSLVERIAAASKESTNGFISLNNETVVDPSLGGVSVVGPVVAGVTARGSIGLEHAMMGWWGRYLAPEVPLAAFSRERVLQQKCCAQMLVSSECIRSQPRALYTRLFHWIMTTPLPRGVPNKSEAMNCLHFF